MTDRGGENFTPRWPVGANGIGWDSDCHLAADCSGLAAFGDLSSEILYHKEEF